MYFIKDIEDLERFISYDERERPANYKEHFYPCFIEYEEPWDLHFCGQYYFVKLTPEETRNKRIKYLEEKRLTLLCEIQQVEAEIKNLKEQEK